MSITEGDISANFRFNNRTGLLVPETITDERQIVAPLPEFSGDYGFTLNETPQTDIAGITQVMRVSDSQIFTHTNLATVGLTEYFFDYSNDMPTLFFNAANNGEEFSIQYFGVGGAVNGKNIFALVDDGMAAVIAPIEAQIVGIESDVAILQSNDGNTVGNISGGIEFNTTLLPPKILSGSYDISENKVKLTSDSSLALSDVFQQSKNTLDTFVHYLVCMNSAGDKKYVMYGEGAVRNGTISSITSVGTTYTLTIATGTAAVDANRILVIEGNNNINGVFKITGGNGTTTYTFTTQAGFTNGGASGTWKIYYRLSSLHQNGSPTAIDVDVIINRYSASLGENGSTSIAAFSQNKNGFYLTLSGLTDYRVLGSFFTDTTPNVSRTVFSYKSGRNKNDNFFSLYGVSSKVTNAVRMPVDGARGVLYGCDYIWVDSVGAGTEFTTQRDLLATANFIGISGSGTMQIEVAILGTSTNTISNSRSEPSVYVNGAISSETAVTLPLFKIGKGQILKPFASTSVANGDIRVRFMGSFTI